MSKQRMWVALSVFMLAAIIFGGCVASQPTAPAASDTAASDTAASAPAESGEAAAPAEGAAVQIPDIEEGKYNVAFIYVGPHDDGGWSQAHDVGRQYVEANLENVHTAYIENVAEGADAEQVIRSLARKGFDVIFTTSFGFMDASEMVATEFPDTDIIHISGFKSNGANFGNLMGAMENIKYLAGMLAGSRAKVDGNPKLGYIATFPIPEELRLGNAFALGARRPARSVRWTCAGSTPGTTRSSRRKPLPRSSIRASRS
jgi:basic membrane protein A